ncbi:MAG: UDP-glucose 6-dehydrogenase [Candidatus Shapirobacteria bacterium GW2011_GWF2_37_20]|nr:MAG: UDP-glucose 6-dehydrogenase [Candidatus Shapirobacteria bacterium GW2011_GWF2_37_20]
MIDNLEFAPDFYKAVEGADCLVITTEWKVFKEADLKKIKSLMKSPNIVDGRNVFNVKEMKDKGFNYISVGR